MVISATDTLDRSRMCSSIYQGIVLCVLPAPPARRLRMTRGPVAPAAQRRHLAPPLRLQVKGLYQILVKVTVAVAVLSSESHADCRCLKALVRERRRRPAPPSRLRTQTQQNKLTAGSMRGSRELWVALRVSGKDAKLSSKWRQTAMSER